jgi:16S rRNA (adenine1518-N6/adenine1519-N6)-dimethyltransferase
MEKKYRKKHNRSLGQHFLVDGNAVKKIIALSKIDGNDVVYEVGSGHGILTNELCKISKFVHSFEIDPYLYYNCKSKLPYGNLNLYNLDGFDNIIGVRFDIFFSSLPYSESRHAFSWLCQKDFKKGILLLQREFVEKLLSLPGDKNYRAISIIAQYRFYIRVLLDVPPSAFTPQPRVESVLIEISPRCQPLSKKIMDDIQFLLSFKKKNISFLLKYFKKSKENNGVFDFSKIIDKKLGQLPVEQIYQLSLFLNKG